MTVIATTRQEYSRAQRNIALQACNKRIRTIAADQVAGVIPVEEAIERYREAVLDGQRRVAEVDRFEAQERPSRLLQQRLRVAGGVEP